MRTWIRTGSGLALALLLSAMGGEGVSAATTKTPAWGGPLAASMGKLSWVDGHRATREDLAGHPVIVEFWTFACVNCKRTLPAMQALDRLAHERGWRVVSIHTPELEVERDPAHVAAAVEREGVKYPVALDPDFVAWKAFGNRYWPCLYVLDGRGQVRFSHIGELHEGTAAWNGFVSRVDALAEDSN